MAYDLSIALRVSPTLNKKQIYFNSKYDLVKTCFESFINALEGITYELFIILDGCPKFFDNIFKGKVRGEDLRIIHVNGIGNSATFTLQTSILSNMACSEYVYFAEDDYLYIDPVREMLELLSNNRFIDFLSPYDHPDYYFRKDLHPYKICYLKYGNRLWKNVMSTCCTFMTRKRTLKEVYALLQSYKKIGDHYMWYLLTRRIPLKNMMKISPHPRYLHKMAYLIKFMRKSSSKRAYSLWAPEPTIATHMQQNCLSPKINWNKYLNDYKAIILK